MTITPLPIKVPPPLASVGLLEDVARERGLKFRMNQEDTSTWYSSCGVGERDSRFKVLVHEPSGRILGAHLLGPDAGETINLFALAIRKRLTTADLEDVIFSYPALGSDVKYMI